jgi:hypothetical protein
MSNESMRFVDGLENDAYHKTKAVSKSVIDMVARDIWAPMWSRDCPQDTNKLKTFDFGDAMHAICLEPDRLKSEFVVMPEINGRTNAGKEEKADFLEANKNHKILTSAEYKQLKLMFESVMAHMPARKLIEAEGIAERSYFWKDENTGLDCKCRPDKYLQGQSLIVDVKTAPELSKFHYSVDDYRYYVQDPWYCDGVGRFDGEVRMEFLVIQKTIEIGRYPVMVVKLPTEAIEYGRAVYRENLNRYAEFLDSGSEPETMELAMSWKFNQRADEHFGEIF